MPTVMGLQGADFGEHVITTVPAVDCDSLHPYHSRCIWGAEQENGFLAWLRRQHPVVGAGAVLGLSAVTGLAVAGGAVALVRAFGGGADELAGARPRRRRRRRR